MGEKGKRARELFLSGCNCSQAVFCAFADDLGLDQKTAMKLSSSFGGGMGRLREVCGTVSAMFMVIGLLYGYDDPKDREAKNEHYLRVQELARRFREENGSIVCRELLPAEQLRDNSPLPAERTPEYYKKRPCPNLVAYAADLLDAYIAEQNA